ncbi:hypothetical protein [Siccibacter turicensis]|uniref:hypothetical protein n=1 Tax=Siccibacter turicensis TaxID=357233 RepID=UPI0023F258CD|nr:hypothetical protein [Siccibacter turicensis]
MAIPVYLWLKDDGGNPVKGSVEVHQREGSMIVRCMLILLSLFSASGIAASNQWSAYIQRIERADNETIRALPDTINHIGVTLDDDQSETLAIALSVALIKDPVSVINATAPLEQSSDALKNRFGTSLICSLPGMLRFTPPQIDDYFAKAEPTLERAGPAAAACLENLRETVAELRHSAG